MSDDHKALVPADVNGRRLAPVVEQALAQSPTPETISALLDVQERWEASEARKAFSRALVALKRSMPSTLGKDAVVDFPTAKGRTYYRHTSIAAMMDVVDEHLPRHGFAMSWTTSQSDRGTITVTCRLLHEDGHSEETSLSAAPDTGSGRNPVQAVASTVTYLKRYTGMSLLGLASGEEQEPHGPAAAEVVEPDSVDAGRNREAAAYLVRKGLSIVTAEEQVGRSVQDWTDADLAVVRQWVSETLATDREPGEEG